MAAQGTAGPPGTLLRDALITTASRFGLAALILATDLILARLLGPAAKGRFTLVLLYSQLAALVLGWGTDQALAVVAGRDLRTARRGVANALVWTAVVGGFGVVLSGWLYGLADGPTGGAARAVLPNLASAQFVYAALAVPGELVFSLGLFALIGRRQIGAYAMIRLLRRLVLLAGVVAMAAVARLSLDAALALNLAALVLTGLAIGVAAGRAGLLGARPSAALLAEELRFGTRALPGALAERLQFRADAFLLNALVGVRATGIYSVTSGLAETLWYVPNALGVVMFSRAVSATEDPGRVAAILTRTTIGVAAASAIPAFLLGPAVVRIVYGAPFADAGVALRLILPGVVAYSAVAVLTRYISGRGRPGLATLIMACGLATNVTANLLLIPTAGINGAAAASSISYVATAVLTVAAFRRLSGRGWIETLVLRPSDLRALGRRVRAAGRPSPAAASELLGDSAEAARVIIAEREPGDEP